MSYGRGLLPEIPALPDSLLDVIPVDMVVGVITAPDKPAGRGLKVTESAVKKYAVSADLPVLQPEKLKNPAFLEELAALKADLQIVVAFRMLPEVVWAMPPLGTFNLHASLLPQYRGAAPLNWAVINGETETGVTTFLLSHEIDTGNILFREKEPIAHEDTAGDLHDRLMVKGARLVLRTVDALASGDYTPIPQEELFTGAGEPKGAPKLFREDMRIDWRAPAEQVRNLIRGLSPWPAAWTMLRHQETGMDIEMKILRVRIGSHVGEGTPPGMLRSDGKKSLEVACGDRWVQITDLQLAGKKRMQTAEFLRGFPHIRNYSAL
ncbi:MAG TPA: methionyl-tRNA formyltransferase [Prolixibacteraceae bacterium]|nr:methionyl-tRNA formyltransferase [Prolixibacteraceae bacterium]